MEHVTNSRTNPFAFFTQPPSRADVGQRVALSEKKRSAAQYMYKYDSGYD
jgi:membrane-bound lytic murein transglycosylase MltF